MSTPSRSLVQSQIFSLLQMRATTASLKCRRGVCVANGDRKGQELAVALAGVCGPGDDQTRKLRTTITQSFYLRGPGFPSATGNRIPFSNSDPTATTASAQYAGISPSLRTFSVAFLGAQVMYWRGHTNRLLIRSKCSAMVLFPGHHRVYLQG